MSHINDIRIFMYLKTCKITSSTEKINNYENQHLICCIGMSSTQSLSHNISEKLNKDNEKQALF